MQLQGLLGLQSNSAADFVSTIMSFFGNLQHTRIGDAGLGISSVIILLLLRVLVTLFVFFKIIKNFKFQKLKEIKAPQDAKKSRRMLHTILWLIATARNALIVLLASLISFYCERAGTSPFILTGTVRSGIPNLEFPPFHTTVLSSNGTVVEMNFGGMVSRVKS